MSAAEEIRDPLVLEFLGLRDEYSESELEEALVRHLETFLLELGNDFAFVARQRLSADSLCGHCDFDLGCPGGLFFEYLTRNPENGVA